MTKKTHRKLPITWQRIHEEILSKIRPEFQGMRLKVFLEQVVPKDFLAELCGTSEKTINKSYCGYVYKAKKPEASRRFTHIRQLITSLKTSDHEVCQYNTLPVTLNFKYNWEQIIPESRYTAEDANNEANTLQSVVNAFLDSLPDDSLYIRIRLTALSEKAPYSMVLAILSVIASSLDCFEGPIFYDDEQLLHRIVLPPTPPMEAAEHILAARDAIHNPEISFLEVKELLSSYLESTPWTGEATFLLHQKASALNMTSEANNQLRKSVAVGYEPAVQKYQQNIAQENVLELRSKYQEHKAALDSNAADEIQKQQIRADIHSSCVKCETSLRFSSLISNEICGDIAFFLYYFILKDVYTSEIKETAVHYLEASARYGNKEASTLWHKRQLHSLSITPAPNSSKCTTTGVCYSNTKNVYAATFEKSLPDGWEPQSLSLEEIEKSVDSEESRRFLLFDENYSKNLEDLCRLLQAVKTHLPRKETLKWEIFIRHDSESIHMFIDTAMARLSEYQIPIYILNDAKIAAQQLLSQHPLFYPIRFLPLNSTSSKPLLHFVVVGTSAVSQWLVRESFWLMSFCHDAVQTKITVLAENAEDFVKNLKGCYPGMRKGEVCIQGIELAEIEGINVDLNTAKLADEIEKITNDTSYCYFAVAADTSGESNLELATRIREFLIRATIASRREDLLQNMPPVAVLCRNDQAAWLTRFMVVEGEEYGDRWYNNRGLIPFGQVSSRYTFDEITGGTFEQLSKCIHFQYNELRPQEALEHDPRAVKAEADYYRRQYNQDSSYSIALSMPYRIFQFRETDSVQVFPRAWNILEKSTFSSVEQLKNLASRITLVNEANIEELAEYEHARWTRWMLSRGWMPASFEDAVFAYQCGNPRPQLFSAKLHPCICAYGDQKLLSKMLHEKCGIQKDFYSYDESNIRDTQNLLKLAWIPPKEKTSEKEPDPER